MDERTEAPRPIDGVASPIPQGFYWSLWIGVFAATVWGVSTLVRSRDRGLARSDGGDPSDPDDPDLSEDEPDRR